MATVIYEPKGKAREYSPLAVNLYNRCTHGCTYCYVPAIRHETREEFRTDPTGRRNILSQLQRDAEKLAAQGCTDDILLCFTTDPYMADIDTAVTREALRILGVLGLKAQVLTKGGMRASRDFDLLRQFDFKFGTTLVFHSNEQVAKFEPGAATFGDRVAAIREAHMMDIFTWVSLEPVIDPDETLEIIDMLDDDVDLWKVGKLNHDHELEARVYWPKFATDVVAKLEGLGAKYLLKKDLRAFLPG